MIGLFLLFPVLLAGFLNLFRDLFDWLRGE